MKAKRVRDSKNWPGAWRWGVNFAPETARRVIAIRLGDGDIKYGAQYVGPITLTPKTAKMLDCWAESMLYEDGGYVHLLPADGSDDPSLEKWARDNGVFEEDEEERPQFQPPTAGPARE